MTITKTPVRTVYDGANAAIGLAEFQTGEAVPVEHGGTGGITVAEAKLNLSITDYNIRSLISVTGGGSYNVSTGAITIDATDLSPYETKVNVALKANIVDLTTANVTELNNLYYTVERANSAIDNRVTKSFVDALGIDAATLDGIDSLPFALDTDLTTANVAELTNLYFTDERVYSNVTLVGYATNSNVSLKANVVDLTTANVTELNNLYFTDVRAHSNTISYLTGSEPKTISGTLNVTGNLNVAGSITTLTSNVIELGDPMIYLGADNPADVNDIGIVGSFTNPSYQNTGLVRDASDGVWKLFANILTNPSNNTLDFTHATYSDLKIGDLVAETGAFTGNVTTVRVIADNSELGNVTSGIWTGTSISTDHTDAKITSVANQTGSISNTQLLAGVVTADSYSLLPVAFSATDITTQTAVFTFSKAAFRAAEFLFTVTNGAAYKVVKTLAIHNGSVVTFGDNYLDDNEVTIGDINATYSFDISGDIVRLLVTATSGTASVKGKVSLVAV